MYVPNKVSSMKLIETFGLNRVERHEIACPQDALVRLSPSRKWGVRTMGAGGGEFVPGLTPKEVHHWMSEQPYGTFVTAWRDTAEEEKRMRVQGEMLITKREAPRVYGRACFVKGIKMREAMAHANAFNFDGPLRKQPMRIQDVAEYILAHSMDWGAGPQYLTDCAIEFSYFEDACGVNNERIVVWEIRSY